MRMTYVIHIAAGSVGLLAGYIALFAAKGSAVHRRIGMVFVYAMLAMCVGGLAIALARSVAPEINVPAGLLTAYLIVTALTTVRPLAPGSRVARRLEVGAMLVALGVGLVMVSFAIEAISNGGKRNGMPAFPFVMFAAFGLLGAAGDIQVLRSAPRKGGARLARHLWRMSIALFIAALSFSFQMARILSKHMDVPGIAVAMPMVVVLLTMFYWLWRVRGKRALRGVVQLRAIEAA